MSFQLAGNAPDLYERVMVPLWFGRWAKALLQELALQPGENVLDVACGTGVTTRLAKQLVGSLGQVTGLDINASMLDRAQELAKTQDIEWLESDVIAIDRPENSYDVVLSQHGYHYFPDKPAALAEFLRLLAPGGRMAFSIWEGHSPYTTAICNAVERHLSLESATKQRAQRQTPPAKDLLEQVRAAGFVDVHVKRQELMIDVPLAPEFVPNHLGAMPIAAAFQALPDAKKQDLIDDVEAELADYVQGQRLIYPDAVHVVIGCG